MALIEVNWNPQQRELKQFALLCLGFFLLLGTWSAWNKGVAGATLAWYAVAAVGLAGYFLPGLMRPIYITWMALALPIGWVISHLLLLVVFYLVVTPIGLLMRLFGYDPLNRRLERAAKTYWTPHDPGGNASRYFKQY